MARQFPSPWPWLLLSFTAGAIVALRAAPERWIEQVWAARWVPSVTSVTAAASDASPFPLVAVWASGLLIGSAALWWRSRRAPLLARAAWGLWPWLLVWLLFDASFGIGYRRAPLEKRLALPTQAASAEVWWALGSALREQVERSAPRSGVAVARDAPWWTRALASAGVCVAELEQQLAGRSVPLSVPQRVRRLPAGSMLAGGFAGITDPLSHEVFLDAGLDPVSALQVGLHEYGHAVLAAHEAEAELLGLLAAWNCSDPDVVYAGTLSALLQVSREGGRRFADDAVWAERFRALLHDLPAVVEASWQASREAAERYRSPSLARVAATGYDQYLRSQGVKIGIADYSRGIALLVGVWAGCQATGGTASWCPAVSVAR